MKFYQNKDGVHAAIAAIFDAYLAELEQRYTDLRFKLHQEKMDLQDVIEELRNEVTELKKELNEDR